jgi:hypothetical protein
LWQEACKAGILLGASWFYNFALPEFNDQVMNTLYDIISRIKTDSIRFEGEPPVSPFSQKQRG